MPTDKTLHAEIARRVRKPLGRTIRIVHRTHEVIPNPKPKLPALALPKREHQVYPTPGRYLDGWVPKVRCNKTDWWRFKRAAYARGKRATTYLRELMMQVVREYERENPPPANAQDPPR